VREDAVHARGSMEKLFPRCLMSKPVLSVAKAQAG